MINIVDAGGNGNGHVEGEAKTEAPVLVPVRSEIPTELLDPHGVHSKPYVFPGSEGMPFRGTVPMLKEDDPPERQPQMGSQVQVDILVLSDTEDLKRYRDICQLVANGFGQISYEERKYDEDVKNWRVLVRWFLTYAYVPK
jgi:hypothetical protein